MAAVPPTAGGEEVRFFFGLLGTQTKALRKNATCRVTAAEAHPRGLTARP